MPYIDFSSDKRFYNRLGSVFLESNTEPDNISYSGCDLSLNPSIGIPSCTSLNIPDLITVSVGDSIVMRGSATVEEEVDYVYDPAYPTTPDMTWYRTGSIFEPPPLQNTIPLQSTSPCIWGYSDSSSYGPTLGSNEVLTSGDPEASPNERTYSPPHTEAGFGATYFTGSTSCSISLTLMNGVYDTEKFFFVARLASNGLAQHDWYSICTRSGWAANGSNWAFKVEPPDYVEPDWPWGLFDAYGIGDWFIDPNPLYHSRNEYISMSTPNAAGNTAIYTSEEKTLLELQVIVASKNIEVSASPPPSVERAFLLSYPDKLNFTWN